MLEFKRFVCGSGIADIVDYFDGGDFGGCGELSPKTRVMLTDPSAATGDPAPNFEGPHKLRFCTAEDGCQATVVGRVKFKDNCPSHDMEKTNRKSL